MRWLPNRVWRLPLKPAAAINVEDRRNSVDAAQADHYAWTCDSGVTSREGVEPRG